MLFRFGSATPIARLLDPKLLALYAGSGVFMALAIIHLSRNARIGIEDAAFGALVTTFPNSGFMGIPLILALLGEQAIGSAVLALTVDVVLISSLCLAIAHARHEPGEGGGARPCLPPLPRHCAVPQPIRCPGPRPVACWSRRPGCPCRPSSAKR